MRTPREEPACCRSSDDPPGDAAWYRQAFQELYPLIYSHRDDASALREVSGLLRMMELEGGDRLLDVCCGNGRHLQAFAQAGLEVYGVDLSRCLLEDAQERPAAALRVVRADMRALPFAAGFNGVVNLFTSFGYFLSDEENEAALREMVRVLLPGGVLVVDHMNRARVERDLPPEDSRSVGGAVVRQRRWIEGNRVLKSIEVAKKGAQPVHLRENVRLFRPRELARMMERCGLGRVRFHGSFRGDAFEEVSDRMIAVAQKTGRQA